MVGSIKACRSIGLGLSRGPLRRAPFKHPLLKEFHLSIGQGREGRWRHAAAGNNHPIDQSGILLNVTIVGEVEAPHHWSLVLIEDGDDVVLERESCHDSDLHKIRSKFPQSAAAGCGSD